MQKLVVLIFLVTAVMLQAAVMKTKNLVDELSFEGSWTVSAPKQHWLRYCSLVGQNIDCVLFYNGK